MNELGKHLFLRPWVYRDDIGMVRRFYHDSAFYAARVEGYSVVKTWHCVGDGKPGGDFRLMNLLGDARNMGREHVMKLIDERLVELGYVLLTESQVKTMDLLQ